MTTPASPFIETVAIARIASPLLKDIYENAKDGAKKALAKWNTISYSKKFEKLVKNIDEVKTIWSPGESVSLRSFYHLAKIRNKKSICPVAAISDLGAGNVVIQGIVGQGKSMLLRYLSIQEVIKKENGRLPIFLELRKLTPKINLNLAISNYFREIDINLSSEVFEYLANSGKIVLLLDGFDELDPAIAKEASLDIEHLSKKHPELQFIVSSRPDNEIQKINQFRVVEIATLSQKDQGPFLRALGVDASKSAEIMRAIKDSPSNITELINTPLMLTLVVFVYQSESNIPDELPEFFERLFHTVFTRHDGLKDCFKRQHHSGLSERRLQSLFEAFSFMAQQGGQKRTLNRSQFNECFDLALDYTDGCFCDESNFRKDITRVACLMMEEGIDDITFLHKSIAEYYSAAFIKNSDDKFAIKFYKEASKNWHYWHETLNFLSAIDSFRFSRYFAKPNLINAIEIIKPLMGTVTEVELCKKLPPFLSKATAVFEKIKGKYELTNFGPILMPPNMYLLRVANEMHELIDFSWVLTESEAQALLDGEMQISLNGDSIEVPFGCALMRWSKKSFDQYLDTLEESFLKNISLAEKTSLKMTERPKIFSKGKLSAGAIRIK
ncbi:NACHT domain-containing protein [Sphaerotilus montanus]|uniref:NACHT domain-containing protein n=1 Tax=Sphaerotilus montanus TaxID=522889 RepID=UPI0015D817AB|nr:NACHT domain-containing protein [Sphaerotilus montanus]NZD58488.1 NACHT domain-containing protein [Sphaerotilus montanus]